MQSLFVTVNPANDNNPVFTTSATPGVNENTTAVVTVNATDADDPAQTVTYSITGGADSALFSINGTTGDLTFDAAPDFETPTDANTDNVYQVVVTADDGNGGTTVQSLFVTVNPANDNNPVFTTSATPGVNENTTAVVTVNATDADDPAQTVTYSITGGADSALFSINGTTGDLTFDAAPDFETPTDANTDNVYQVVVTADDGNGGTTVQSLFVTVNPANDAPVAADDAYVVGEDGLLIVVAPGVVANDTDPDTGDALTVQNVDTTGTKGSVVLNPDGSFSYDPNGQFESLAVGDSSSDSFRYTVTDGNGGTSTATVTITINGANDAPTAGDDSYDVFEGDTLSVGNAGVMLNDSDIDGDPCVVSLVSGPANGTLSLNPNGSFTYTPDDLFTGTDSFTYRANDGAVDSNLATVTITVNGVVSPPSGDPPTGNPRPETGGDDDDDTSDDDDPKGPGDTQGEFNDGDPDAPQQKKRGGTTGTGGSTGDDIPGTGQPQDQPGIDIVFPETFALRGTGQRGSTERNTVDSEGQTSNSTKVSTSTSESVSEASGAEFNYIVPGSPLWDDLDALDDQMQGTLHFKDLVVGSALTASTGLTVGYVVWMIRGGMLISSLLAQMPAWRLIDPLVVLGGFDDEAFGEDSEEARESLASLVDGPNLPSETAPEITSETADESQA